MTVHCAAGPLFDRGRTKGPALPGDARTVADIPCSAPGFLESTGYELAGFRRWDRFAVPPHRGRHIAFGRRAVALIKQFPRKQKVLPDAPERTDTRHYGINRQ